MQAIRWRLYWTEVLISENPQDVWRVYNQGCGHLVPRSEKASGKVDGCAALPLLRIDRVKQVVDHMRDELLAIVQPGLPEYRGDVRLDGRFPGIPETGDLVVAEPLDHKQGHVAFGGGQAPVVELQQDLLVDLAGRGVDLLFGMTHLPRAFPKQDQAADHPEEHSDAGQYFKDLDNFPRDDQDLPHEEIRQDLQGKVDCAGHLDRDQGQQNDNQGNVAFRSHWRV